MINAKSETKELLNPTDLTRDQTFCIYESLTVIKTDEDGGLAWARQELKFLLSLA